MNDTPYISATILITTLMPSVDYSLVPLLTTTSIPPSSSSLLGLRVTIIAYCYILPVICVLGIIGNLMNVVTLASNRLRAVSYLYLRALAVADLMCMIFVLLFVSGEILNQLGIALNRSYWYGFYQAHLMLSLINWALSTGVCVVLALSLERYVSVVFPMQFRAWNSPQRAKKAIFISYFIPFVLYFPYSIGRYSVGDKVAVDNITTIFIAVDSETSKTLTWKIYKWTRETILRFLPILILSILNFQIMLAFRKRQQMFARLKNREYHNVSRDETLLYILGGIVAMFFICNIPAAINLLFINETVKKRVDYQIFRAVANLLEITNHAAQFYIFCVCSTDYRVTFMQKFPFPCFQAYYINKKEFCSFLRKYPKSSTERFASTTNNNSTTIVHQNPHQSVQTNSSVTTAVSKCNIAAIPKRSVTAETISIKNNNKVATVTVNEIDKYYYNKDDIHLASEEEDISDGSETFYNLNLIQSETKRNGTTYL